MKLQHLIIVFVIIMMSIVLVLSQYIGAQVDSIATKTKYDTALLGATYDTMAAYELNTRNITNSTVIGEDIRELEAVISTFTKSLSSSMGMTGVNKDYILSNIPAIAFCMYDGYYIYMPNESVAGKEKLQPYVYYSKEYKNTATNTDITIGFSLDNYVSIYGKYDGKQISAAGYLIVPEDITINNFSYLTRNGDASKTEYKVLTGEVIYKGITINKETTIENKPIEGLRNVKETKEDNTDAMMYYYQAKKFTELYNTIIDKLSTTDKEKLKIKGGIERNDPENEESNFNNEKVEVIKNTVTTNLNRAICNFEGVQKKEYEMPQLNGEDWDKILNNISIIAFLKNLPLNNMSTYNNYVVVNSAVTQKYTNPKSMNFIGYDVDYNSKGYYHKITCTDFINEINSDKIQNLIGYSATEFERYKHAVVNDREYYYFYKHNEYADYDCEVEPIESANVATINDYLSNIEGLIPDKKVKILKAYYTAIARIRFRLNKPSSYVNSITDTSKFTITFDLEGGTWTGNTTQESEYKRITISHNVPTKIGYAFYSWKLNNGSTGETVKPGDTIYSDIDLNLKAEYKEQYIVTYHDNGSIFMQQTKLDDVDLEMLRDIPNGESGQTFRGWATTPTGAIIYSVTDYSNWIIKDNANVDLYAIFSDAVWTIRYIDEIGNGSQTLEIVNGNSIIINGISEVTGYRFLGWATSFVSSGLFFSFSFF